VAIKKWHVGKIVIVWVVDVLVLIWAIAVPDDMRKDAMGIWLALSVAAAVITWRWFSGREQTGPKRLP